MRKQLSTEQLGAERDALIQEIHAAFKGVTREGGVSWSESVVIDDGGSDEKRQRVRSQDRETSWEELIDDSNWRSDRGVGGFSFLDPIGFRYYLAPAMIRCTRPDDGGSMNGFRLTIPTEDPSSRAHKLEQLSSLDQRQRACVVRFLRYMIDASWLDAIESGEEEYARICTKEWESALNSGWSDPTTFADLSK